MSKGLSLYSSIARSRIFWTIVRDQVTGPKFEKVLSYVRKQVYLQYWRYFKKNYRHLTQAVIFDICQNQYNAFCTRTNKYGLTRFQDTGLDSSDGHSAYASYLVYVLQRQAQRLLRGPRRGLDRVQGLYIQFIVRYNYETTAAISVWYCRLIYQDFF